MKQPESRGAVLAAAYARLRRDLLANKEIAWAYVPAMVEVVGGRKFEFRLLAEESDDATEPDHVGDANKMMGDVK